MSEIRSFKVPGGHVYAVPEYEEYAVYDYSQRYYGYLYRGDTVYEVYTELFVPDGTWVMERPMCGYTRLIGVSWDDIRRAKIDKRWRQERTLLMADRPFGFIQAPESCWVPGTIPGTDIRAPKSWQKLSYARQVHKGEVGAWGITIPKLKFAREHPDLTPKLHSFPRGRDQKRSPHRWARLSDVVTASRMRRHELLLDTYWPFVGGNYYVEPDISELLIHVRCGDTHAEISAQLTRPSEVSQAQLLELIDEVGIDKVWIRSGLANTILRLQALQYDPKIMFAPVPVQA